MSEHDITRLIAANPITSTPPVQQVRTLRPHRASNTLRWLVGTAGVAAAATTVVMLWTSDTDNIARPQQPAMVPAIADRTTSESAPTQFDHAMPVERLARSSSPAPTSYGSGIGAQRIEQRMMDEAPDVQRSKSAEIMQQQTTAATTIRPATLLSVTAAELALLRIEHTGPALRYEEDGAQITVRTNGISASGATIRSTQPTPLHITLYRKGINFARWFDHAAAPTIVNDMIGIQVWLRDPSKPTFQEADVILWYAPTEALISALPERHRLRIRNALQTASSTPDQPVERRTVSASIASVSIAPNPVRGSSATLTLDVRTTCTTQIRIIDMMARPGIDIVDGRVFDAGQQSITLNGLEALPTGMYVVIIDIPETNERLVHRLLIER